MMKSTQVFGTAPYVKVSFKDLNLPPNSAFPFFDREKITMPALVLFIISMENVGNGICETLHFKIFLEELVPGPSYDPSNYAARRAWYAISSKIKSNLSIFNIFTNCMEPSSAVI